ncbi:hypothetical protein FA13DRAFT_1798051 [Coprinellus micaceus]|uniref:Uncharacterized protein n=1 Tax=Coprinellus micaceus TaxID=71717 RepID=A0A4Y7SP63_COPMI|nr:hypothetical protein FA13DRAFT_1798051 [Coprinellus micaceus]
MAGFTLITALVSLSVTSVLAAPQGTGGGGEGGAGGFVPLINKQYTWDNIPYKVDTDRGLARGEQLGYNRCNSTTEGPESLCQTAIINSLDDFCFWAPPEPGRAVGEIEGEMVAWCTQPGHGTRVIPDGTITGVQFTKAPNYVQVVGFMDQTKVDMDCW